MKTLPQEELIEHLKNLNLPELKAAISCGVPGYAQNIAKMLLKDKKDALELFISEGGVEAVMGTETEDDGMDIKKDEDEASSPPP